MELDTALPVEIDLPFSPRDPNNLLENGIELCLLGRRHSHKSDGKISRTYNDLGFKTGFKQRKRRTFVKLVLHTYQFEIVTYARFPRLMKPSVQRLALADIAEVREGKGTHNFQRYGNAEREDRCFSLILSRDLRNACVSLDFVCQSESHARGILTELNRAMTRSRWLTSSAASFGFGLRRQREAFWEDQFRKFDADGNGVLSVSELGKLLTVLGFPNSVKERFEDSEQLSIAPSDFVRVCRNIRTSEALRPLFNELCSSKGGADNPLGLNANALETFMILQEEDPFVVNAHVRKVLEQCADPSTNSLDFLGFCDYILSTDLNCALRPFLETFNDNLSLSKYLISSSHNTYLLADQLSGSSGVVAYINAFKRGFRCIEVDVHNGFREPIITHKNAFTEALTFEAFARAAKQHAFTDGITTPLVVSIENHCTPAFQGKIAKILLRHWGAENILMYRGTDDQLPALKDLQRKFILKGKVNTTTNPEYASMLFLRSSTSKKAASGIPVHETVSLDEDAVGRIMLPSTFAEDHLVRVYPKGSRIYSSNLNPIAGWSEGYQMVALNCQTHCQRFRINQLLFQDSEGYVPLGMLRTPRMSTDGVSMRILMGSMLPRSKQRSKSPLLRVQVFLYDILETSPFVSNADLKVTSDPDESKEAEKQLLKSSRWRWLAKSAFSTSQKQNGRKYGRRSDIPILSRGSTAASLFDEPIYETDDVADNSFNPAFKHSEPIEIRKFTSSAMILFLVVDRSCSDKVRAFGGGLLSRFRPGVRALPMMDSSGLPLDGSCLLLNVHMIPASPTTIDKTLTVV